MYVSRLNQVERMRAIVQQAVDLGRQRAAGVLHGVTMIVYGTLSDSAISEIFEQVSHGTLAHGAALRIERAGSRYICWNCCGVRFDSGDGLRPNCGELAMEVPEEIEFGLKDIEVGA